MLSFEFCLPFWGWFTAALKSLDSPDPRESCLGHVSGVLPKPRRGTVAGLSSRATDVAAPCVVDPLPLSQLAVEFLHLQRAGRDLIKLLGVRLPPRCLF